MWLKNKTKNFFWTKHSREKMKYYNLSESRLKRVYRHPYRVEFGIAPDTMAAMQPAGSKQHPYEVWIMYQLKDGLIKIISAWRYPGKSLAGDKPPIPADILNELDLN